MKRITAFVFTGALLGACNGDDTTEIRKGQVDEGALQDGVVVTISGNTGTVEVPMSVPVPNEPDDEIEMGIEGSVALVVTSNISGASADLAAGTLVESNPSAAGEYAWSLNEDRDLLTLEFYNETPGGLTLKTDRTYNTALAITFNPYVETLPAMQFQASPAGG